MRYLTGKQQRFVNEYLVDLNATEAARRAGYKGNDNTLGQVGFENLKKPDIADAIQEAMQKRADATNITAERVLKEIARLAFADSRRLFNEDGSPKPIQELDDDTAATIAGFEVLEQYEGTGENRKFIGYVKKIKAWDKNSALEKLCKHLAMFNDKLDVNHRGKVQFIEGISEDEFFGKATE